jgi:transcriptional regulator with XRE-family HTH domain
MNNSASVRYRLHRLRPRGTRLDRGWTQEDLAHKTGLATVQVSRIERGKREIRLTTLVRLIDGLEVPADSLLDGLLKRS